MKNAYFLQKVNVKVNSIMNKYDSYNHTKFSIKYHIILSVKYHKRMLAQIADDLKMSFERASKD